MKKSFSKIKQRGASLIVVLIVLLLVTVSLLGAYRISHMNEIMTGNLSNYNLAFVAAEAAIRDAEADIMKNPANKNRISSGVGFPRNQTDAHSVLDLLAGSANRCKNGVCSPNIVIAALSDSDFNSYKTTFGQYTSSATSTSKHPLLNQAGYIIQLYTYTEAVNSPNLPINHIIPDRARNIIYKITSVGYGFNNTRVQIESYFVPFPSSQSQ